MIKHLFKLIWNKKKQNFLLMMEILVSFIVMFAVFTLLVYYYQNYSKPKGFDYEDVWVVNYTKADNDLNMDSVTSFRETLMRSMKSLPQVKDMSFTNGNVPFAMSTNDSYITGGHGSVLTNIHAVEDSYAGTLSLKLLEGRWFNQTDASSKLPAVVLNDVLKEKLFGQGSALNRVVTLDDHKKRVVGVVAGFKDKGDYQAPEPSIFLRLDTSHYNWLNSILVRVAPGTGADFEGKLYKLLAASFKNANVEIEHLDKKRQTINLLALVPMIALLVIGGFLIVNVALGLFGILWYTISKRKSEIGLRRAVGASAGSISSQLVAEALVLATISLLVGSFFAVQFPLLHVFDLPSGVYLLAQLLAIVFIYLLVIVCALYPGKQAAAIFPAVALHEE